MHLFLKRVTGVTTPVDVSEDVTVAEFKAQQSINGNIFFGGMCLEDGAALGDYPLQAGSTITAMLPVEGGKGKKKKKRIFTKPKKPTHRHKLEKMRALKYFKVTENADGSYKVERTRQECPHPQCGAGVFMAVHKNRQYCGKCHLTYTSAK